MKNELRCSKCKNVLIDDNFEELEVTGGYVLLCDDCRGLVKKCEVYSRVVGYMRPVEAWNVGKKEEFKDRKEYKL